MSSCGAKGASRGVVWTFTSGLWLPCACPTHQGLAKPQPFRVVLITAVEANDLNQGTTESRTPPCKQNRITHCSTHIACRLLKVALAILDQAMRSCCNFHVVALNDCEVIFNRNSFDSRLLLLRWDLAFDRPWYPGLDHRSKAARTDIDR